MNCSIIYYKYYVLRIIQPRIPTPTSAPPQVKYTPMLGVVVVGEGEPEIFIDCSWSLLICKGIILLSIR